MFHKLKLRCGSFVDFMQYSVIEISVNTVIQVSQLAIFGYVPRGMKITLPDVSSVSDKCVTN